MPALSARCPDPARAATRGALAAIAVLALLAAAQPAEAIDISRPKVMVKEDGLVAGPLQVFAEIDPASRQASAGACLEHDPIWRLDAGRDSDGDVVVWLPAGHQEADGSHKARPTCGQGAPGQEPCLESDFFLSRAGQPQEVCSGERPGIPLDAAAKPIDPDEDGALEVRSGIVPRGVALPSVET